MNGLKKVVKTLAWFAGSPRRSLRQSLFFIRGDDYAKRWITEEHERGTVSEESNNDLFSYFEAHTEGSGIWKWKHYFEIYDRHLRKFRGQEVHVVEVGIYGGGSLGMWKHYFGNRCLVYGVDIQPECKQYGEEGMAIYIGDQGDRAFWRDFKKKVPKVDILIDDGGHTAEQQIVTLEEMLPHIRAGGVYVCEDITGMYNPFSDYLHGLGRSLNHFHAQAGEPSRSLPSAFQKDIHSIHHYPLLTVVEKRGSGLTELSAPQKGTSWMPCY